MIQKIFFSFLIFFLISCDQAPVKESDELIVGTAADNPPYEFIQNNDIVGLDIDIIKLIAEKLNKKLVIKNMEFYSLLPSLETRKIDLVISGASSTEAREKIFDFSHTYFTSEIVLVVLQDSGIMSVEDLNKKVLTVQTGTIFENLANNSLGSKYDCEIISLSNFFIAVEKLKSGSASGLITEKAQADNLVKYNPNFKIITLPVEEVSEYVIIMPKGSLYKVKVNEIIADLIKSGAITQIKEKWLK